MTNLIIIGAGGHGKCIAEMASMMNKWDEIAFLDDNKVGLEILGFPVLDRATNFENYLWKFKEAFVAIGHNQSRLILLNQLINSGFDIPVIIHPNSIVSEYSNIGAGTSIHAGAVINPDVVVGKGSIINTSATIDHDCNIGDGVHISPGSHVGGTTIIKNLTWVGIGSSISNNLSIGRKVIVAGGAMVIKDVPDDVMVAGVPAVIKKAGVNNE
jgi:sugar O-acyltransferase (sialic acid O-acetyltransferase NeuD family)